MGDSQQLHTTAMKQSLIIILVAVAAISLATQDFDEDVTPVPEDEVSASASTSELTEFSLQRGRRVHPAHKKKRLASELVHKRVERVHKHVKKKAWKKYNRWGELTESKFGHFKKDHSGIHARARDFERVHKKYVKRAKKAAKRLKKHRKSRYRRGKNGRLYRRKHTRWGELTESKFGLFKKHFERVHKKYFKRANKAAKRLKKHRCRSRRYRYIRRTGRCIRRKHGMGFKYKKYKNRRYLRRRL